LRISFPPSLCLTLHTLGVNQPHAAPIAADAPPRERPGANQALDLRTADAETVRRFI
jgi:hypothetical protein